MRNASMPVARLAPTIILLALLLAGIVPCNAQTTTVGTTGHWNGVDGDAFGGLPTTVGQTFVAPAGVTNLKSLAFFVDDTAPMTFEAFIMAWDGTAATGPVLFQSGTLTTTDNGGAGGFERFNVVISGTPVVPGANYVAFLVASAGAGSVGVTGGLGDDPYADGGLVFQDSAVSPWDTFLASLGVNLAFELVFENASTATDEAVTILLVDAAAIFSVLFSSVPTALAQRELALGASRVTLRDFNGRLFRQRAGWKGGSDGVGVWHTVTVGEGDGIEPARGGKGTKVVYATAPPESHRWEVFTSFDYGSLDMDANRDFLGLRSDTYAESIGAELSLTSHILVGAGVSYLESYADHSADIEGVTMAAYASGAWGGLHADLLYGATLLDHDIDRDTGTGSTAHARPGSTTHTVSFNTGYNFRPGQWSVGPFAGVDYARSKIDGYTESGGGTAATEVSEQTVDSLLTRMGVQASYRFEQSWGSITPQVRVGWERENLGSDDDLTVGLLQSPYYLVQGSTIRSTGAGFEVTVPGQDRERDYMTVGAGVLVEIGARLHVLLDYEGDFLDDGFAAHYGKVSVGWRF